MPDQRQFLGRGVKNCRLFGTEFVEMIGFFRRHVLCNFWLQTGGLRMIRLLLTFVFAVGTLGFASTSMVHAEDNGDSQDNSSDSGDSGSSGSSDFIY
jgi:hypothetical protein